MTKSTYNPLISESAENNMENFRRDCPKVFKALEERAPRKLVIQVPKEHLDTAETMLRESHWRIHSDKAPFIAVDVAELLEREGVTPDNFNREMIYSDALTQLPEDSTEAAGRDALDKFQRMCAPYGDAKTPVLLFIRNFDAVTSQLPDNYPWPEIGRLLLTTVRIGGNFKICLHVTDTNKIPDPGSRLNDAQIVLDSEL